jgi:hypothetical protein
LLLVVDLVETLVAVVVAEVVELVDIELVQV